MASKAVRPGRTLFIFGLVIACLYGGVALGGNWKPKLGLDLQGGTRITLEATTETGVAVSPDKLKEAAGIIDNRVNGSGVAEATVATQGSKDIVVEIPGKNRRDLVDAVSKTALLRFRLVAASAPGRTNAATPTPSPSGQATPSGKADPSGKATPSDKANPSAKATPKGRAVSGGLLNADKAKPSAKPQPPPTPAALPSQPAQAGRTAAGAPVGKPLEWMNDPGSEWTAKFAAFTCPAKGKELEPVADVKDQPLLTCDEDGTKYLLSASAIEGTELKKASSGIPQGQLEEAVDLTLNSQGRKTFADISQAISGTQKQFAIVLDGVVLSAPVVNEPILNGSAQITGSFTQAEAQSLANSLSYGALPLKFTAPVVTEEGPSLASDQLSAGLWAGAVGLLLVIIYCMLYYRGLGLVVVSSLGVAGIVVYATVLIMSSAVGFTLTLPGIAGLIVAVGITADSFIVYFERIRDEMRDGRSMRVAVEAGWIRARATCVAADAVSLLAAVVLYIFAIGVVKGFAFTLGISTAIDLIVFFFFTKPMVSWFATFPFFNTGHKWSGLSPDHVGTARITPDRGPVMAGGSPR